MSRIIIDEYEEVPRYSSSRRYNTSPGPRMISSSINPEIEFNRLKTEVGSAIRKEDERIRAYGGNGLPVYGPNDLDRWMGKMENIYNVIKEMLMDRL